MMYDQEATPIALLGQALNFSPEDLQANRNGKFSRRQRRVLLGQFWRNTGITLFLLIAPIVVALILVLWGTDESLLNTLNNREMLIGYLVGGVLGFLYTAGNYRRFLIVFDVINGYVASIRGEIFRYGMYLEVERERFLMEETTLDLIQTGLKYRFYYTPYARQILSVEFAE